MAERDFKDSRKAAGYSLEELWFFRYNQELIGKLREKLGRKREDRPERAKLTLIQGGKQEGSGERPVDAPVPLKKVA